MSRLFSEPYVREKGTGALRLGTSREVGEFSGTGIERRCSCGLTLVMHRRAQMTTKVFETVRKLLADGAEQSVCHVGLLRARPSYHQRRRNFVLHMVNRIIRRAARDSCGSVWGGHFAEPDGKQCRLNMWDRP
jgi:hypothetical protein